jgi:SAM-dependent methyltransferase
VLYFKHNELVARFRVSLKTVHNWIDSAKRGKVSLQLHEHNGKTYIANTAANVSTLERQAESGKKFRNSLHHKVVTPDSRFYDMYNRRQIRDIIFNLNTHHEIPRQYNYFADGAANWDNWLRRLEAEEAPNILKGTIELMSANIGALDALIRGYERINVIDLGVGNARPVKGLLEHLLQRKLLHRYIALDISDTMLNIAGDNIKSWFGNSVRFEGYVRDISYERFDDLLIDDMLDKDADKTLNLVLLLGATPTNFRSFADIIRTVCGSMGDEDLLIYSDKPDTEASRRYLDFSPKSGSFELSPNHRYILDLMNISDSYYTVEMGYNEQKGMRYIRIRLKSALTIKFKFDGAEREVSLEKGDTILLLRVWHMSALEIISEFEKSGFTLLQSSLTKDRQFLLTISGVEKTELGRSQTLWPYAVQNKNRNIN